MPLQVRSLAEWEREGITDMLSVVIPAHNEEGHIADTVGGVTAALEEAKIRYEILVVNDNSVDRTEIIARALGQLNPAVRCLNNDPPNGFGFAVRRGLAGFQPLLAQHFNLTVELPLKSVVRGYRYAVVPNSWDNRKQGTSKFEIKEMGSRYFFIVLYCFLEKSLMTRDLRTSPQIRETQLQVWNR